MIKPHYSPEQIQNRYIACSVLLCPPSLDAVVHSSGVHEGMPYLYNSREAASDDISFLEDTMYIIPAYEYYERLQSGNFKF